MFPILDSPSIFQGPHGPWTPRNFARPHSAASVDSVDRLAILSDRRMLDDFGCTSTNINILSILLLLLYDDYDDFILEYIIKLWMNI